jgi:predicted ribosomally synthesized peptide with SipW-like signal peptide
MTMMKKGNVTILASILAIALVAAGVGAGTMAYFSSYVKSDNNVFTAGTLTLTSGGIKLYSVDLANLKPGDLIKGDLTVTNDGTLGGYLYGRCSYVETLDPGSNSDLGNVLTVTKWTEGGNTYYPNIKLNLFTAQTGVILPDYGGTWMPYGPLASKASYTFGIEILFDLDAGNIYQGDSITLTFEILLHQLQKP